MSEDQRVTDLLLWIEPQPIRGRHDEFFQHAVFLAEALLLQREAGMRFSLFSNRAVLTRLARDCPAVRPALRHPTEWETRALDAHAGPWTEARLRVWLDLVDGRGAAADLHRDIAARLIAERRPDAVLMWSDNGAVRQAAAEAGVPVLSCELGPTRPPFPTTFYIDPDGTNGRAAMRRVPLAAASAGAELPAALAALRDRPCARPDAAPEGGFALVPLQLSDDLNMRLHSDHVSPLAFLADTLPRLLDRHERVAVKGHPGAAGREINAHAQSEALDFASAFDRRVVVLPERLAAPEQLWLLRHAALVCALNSSVAFEAAALGTPVVLLGDAAYDLGGTLKRPPDRLHDPAGAADRASLVAANCRWFLHRKDSGEAGSAILRAVAAARLGGPDWRAALEVAEAAEAPRPPATAGPPSRLRGYVEAVEERAAPDGGLEIGLRGWLHDAARDRPVERIAVVAGDRVLAETADKSLRPDVSRRLSSRACSLGFDLSATCPRDHWQRAVLAVWGGDGVRRDFAIAAGRLTALGTGWTAGLPPQATRRDGIGVGAGILATARARLFMARLLGRAGRRAR